LAAPISSGLGNNSGADRGRPAQAQSPGNGFHAIKWEGRCVQGDERMTPNSVRIPLETTHARNYERAPWCYLLWGVPAVLAVAAGAANQQGGISLAVAGLLWAFSVGWIGVGCFINGRSCGRVHCKVDGYLFPPLAVAGLLNALAVVTFSWNLYWGIFWVILLASFVPEFTWRRYLQAASRPRRPAAAGQGTPDRGISSIYQARPAWGCADIEGSPKAFRPRNAGPMARQEVVGP
jgi:hypothetical protein